MAAGEDESAVRAMQGMLLSGLVSLLLVGCGSTTQRASRPPATATSKPTPATLYKWPSLSTYPPFAGSVARSDTCVVSTQLKAVTTSAPKIVECWVGKVAGHPFVYAAFYTLDKQGYQVTVDGSTQIEDTTGIPDLYQFSGDYGCTGSDAAYQAADGEAARGGTGDQWASCRHATWPASPGTAQRED